MNTGAHTSAGPCFSCGPSRNCRLSSSCDLSAPSSTLLALVELRLGLLPSICKGKEALALLAGSGRLWPPAWNPVRLGQRNQVGDFGLPERALCGPWCCFQNHERTQILPHTKPLTTSKKPSGQSSRENFTVWAFGSRSYTAASLKSCLLSAWVSSGAGADWEGSDGDLSLPGASGLRCPTMPGLTVRTGIPAGPPCAGNTFQGPSRGAGPWGNLGASPQPFTTLPGRTAPHSPLGNPVFF